MDRDGAQNGNRVPCGARGQKSGTQNANRVPCGARGPKADAQNGNRVPCSGQSPNAVGVEWTADKTRPGNRPLRYARKAPKHMNLAQALEHADSFSLPGLLMDRASLDDERRKKNTNKQEYQYDTKHTRKRTQRDSPSKWLY